VLAGDGPVVRAIRPIDRNFRPLKPARLQCLKRPCIRRVDFRRRRVHHRNSTPSPRIALSSSDNRRPYFFATGQRALVIQ